MAAVAAAAAAVAAVPAAAAAPAAGEGVVAVALTCETGTVYKNQGQMITQEMTDL